MWLANFTIKGTNRMNLPTLTLLMAPIPATGMDQKMHRNQMKAVLRMLSVLVTASDLTVFFQI